MRKPWPLLTLFPLFPSCAPVPPPRSGFVGNEQSLPQAMLEVHNRERRAFGVAPLMWDPAIAAQASVHAALLARIGRLQHSTRQARGGLGENLWIGTRSAYPYAVMAGHWAAERRLFRPGRFPANSRTGNWADVGHFTQIVWPTTTRIGCAVAADGQREALVCRYAPAGNVDGAMLSPR